MAERWKPVPGYETLYEVSSLGRVRSIKNGRCRPVKLEVSRWNYLRVNLHRDGDGGTRFMVHRLVLRAFKGLDPPEVDHKNRVHDDNRLSNLRPSTRLLNARNRNPSYSNRSGVTGVNWYQKPGRPGKWRATLIIGRKTVYRGMFNTIEEAAKARKRAERNRDGRP